MEYDSDNLLVDSEVNLKILQTTKSPVLTKQEVLQKLEGYILIHNNETIPTLWHSLQLLTKKQREIILKYRNKK